MRIENYVVHGRTYVVYDESTATILTFVLASKQSRCGPEFTQTHQTQRRAVFRRTSTVPYVKKLDTLKLPLTVFLPSRPPFLSLLLSQLPMQTKARHRDPPRWKSFGQAAKKPLSSPPRGNRCQEGHALGASGVCPGARLWKKLWVRRKERIDDDKIR